MDLKSNITDSQFSEGTTSSSYNYKYWIDNPTITLKSTNTKIYEDLKSIASYVQEHTQTISCIGEGETIILISGSSRVIITYEFPEMIFHVMLVANGKAQYYFECTVITSKELEKMQKFLENTGIYELIKVDSKNQEKENE